jgi:hypothetical protein
MRWAGHVAGMGERRGAYSVSLLKHDGKRQLLRPRRRRDGNIKMDLQEVEWSKWIGLIWLGIGTGGELLRMRL